MTTWLRWLTLRMPGRHRKAKPAPAPSWVERMADPTPQVEFDAPKLRVVR